MDQPCPWRPWESLGCSVVALPPAAGGHRGIHSWVAETKEGSWLLAGSTDHLGLRSAHDQRHRDAPLGCPDQLVQQTPPLHHPGNCPPLTDLFSLLLIYLPTQQTPIGCLRCLSQLGCSKKTREDLTELIFKEQETETNHSIQGFQSSISQRDI